MASLHAPNLQAGDAGTRHGRLLGAMAPLFHHGDDPPSLSQLGPQLDEVVQRTAAVPLEQFAAQLMTRYFTTEYLPASRMTSVIDVDTISWDLLPDNSGERLGEPIPDAFFL